MTGPRDTPFRIGIPINMETGQPLTDAQGIRMEKLTEAAEAFRNVMHEAEGSSVDDGWDFRTKRMIRAADLLELALILARREAVMVP